MRKRNEWRTFDEKGVCNYCDYFDQIHNDDVIKPEDRIQKYSELNPLTGMEDAGIRVIGVGIIADKTEDLKTWIVVKDKKTASKIRLGDIVKVTY